VKPLRTALFAPGIKERVMTKALESAADAVILDLEDSVPVAAKAEARALVAKFIDGVVAAAAAGAHDRPRPAIFVRVNGAASGLLSGDLEAVVRPGLDAILLAKAEGVDDVQRTAASIEAFESRRGAQPGSVEIILQIESALGVYHCFDLIKASPRVAATCFGSARDGDLQTDLGCSWSIEGTELLYARSKVLLDTRAAGGNIHPLDGVFSDLNDEAGLIADSRLSARLGYIGRTVIHPKQIMPVRSAYAVPEAEVAYYQKVAAEFGAAEKAGTAAIAVDGKLVDYAMAQRARRVLDLASLDRPR
jgi:citrate lyase subunit beta / citryl-CoA lyase